MSRSIQVKGPIKLFRTFALPGMLAVFEVSVQRTGASWIFREPVSVALDCGIDRS